MRFDRDEFQKFNLARGKFIHDVKHDQLHDLVTIKVTDLPANRLSLDQQERAVRVALDCKVTGDWKLFEKLADEILLSSLGFPEGSPAPGDVDRSGAEEGYPENELV